MNIQESNKLIAEFMQLKNGGDGTYYFPEYNSGDWHTVDDLRYHESWDWLMPVVEKIQSLKEYRTNGKEIATDIWMFLKYNPKTETKLEATHRACVQFIKWYNQNK